MFLILLILYFEVLENVLNLPKFILDMMISHLQGLKIVCMLKGRA